MSDCEQWENDEQRLMESEIEKLRSERDATESALAAKTSDFDRLRKDFDEHDAELKRIIAGLRSNV